MTIRSLDMQVLIPRLNDVARIQHVQQQENNVRQHEYNILNSDQTQKNSTTVNQMLRNESALVHEKEENEKKYKKKSVKKGIDEEKENRDEEPSKRKSIQGSNLDIIV
jgi:hypothetical protein